jgi:hypothetical protein
LDEQLEDEEEREEHEERERERLCRGDLEEEPDEREELIYIYYLKRNY